ncbi:uncharacterized protein [Procambarus clarkii]|uniref:uncharacterized protein n=1 Tax=Procambarus clarkii TaxID=6728 RepID=UPI001E673283|nr:uncharacterized protein LOC123747351 [Procambarus clarkii]
MRLAVIPFLTATVLVFAAGQRAATKCDEIRDALVPWCPLTLTFAECFTKIDGCRNDVASSMSTLANSDISALAFIANNLTTFVMNGTAEQKVMGQDLLDVLVDSATVTKKIQDCVST